MKKILIQLDTDRKSMDRCIRIIPKLHRQHVACEVPGWRWDQCGSAQKGPRSRESIQHSPSP